MSMSYLTMTVTSKCGFLYSHSFSALPRNPPPPYSRSGAASATAPPPSLPFTHTHPSAHPPAHPPTSAPLAHFPTSRSGSYSCPAAPISFFCCALLSYAYRAPTYIYFQQPSDIKSSLQADQTFPSPTGEDPFSLSE